MANKQEKAVNRAFIRGKQQGKVREEKHILALLGVIIIVLLFLLLAQHNGWWPFARPKLGSAFYTNVSASTTAPSGSSTTSSGSGVSGATGNTGSNGTSGGSSGSNGGSGSSGTMPIATFAAGVNVGNTEAQTNAEASGLSPNCAIVVDANTNDSGVGEQQVCTYTQGNKVVTVTFLNNHVISASKSGF